jgi:tetratricopeptide (TPR) repeat protein
MTKKTALDDLMDRELWTQARRYLRKKLKKEPDNHWLWTRLAITYYEDRKYDKALELSERAIELAPRCPLVLWDYAGALDMTGRKRAAIRILKRLLRTGLNRLAHGECGEGIRWTRALLNDCRYSLGLAYWDLGDYLRANQYLCDHLAHRAPGIPSIYSMAEVKEKLSALQEQLGDRVNRGRLLAITQSKALHSRGQRSPRRRSHAE